MPRARSPQLPAAVSPTGAAARVAAAIVVLLVNAVPVVGVLHYGWSVTSVLLLYWFENLLVAACTCVRIATHRRLTRKRGHWRDAQLGVSSNGKPVRGGLLREYATGAFVFTLAHGLFVAMIVFGLASTHADDPMWAFSPSQVAWGALAIATMLAIELAFDLATIRTRSYAWLQDQVRRRMGRVVILHTVIIFGMLAIALTDSPLGALYLLVGLKTLFELGAGAPGDPLPAEPSADPATAEPPGWLLRLADRIGRRKGGAEGFRAHWKRKHEAARKDARDDEETRPA
ncbi:MAG: hypothetical protein EOP90_12965 [Lysobacteraceae bacterium]|nr:MAG: hypothetical protein EOP90_12965 [Xanthomonadaceae bacterium]